MPKVKIYIDEEDANSITKQSKTTISRCERMALTEIQCNIISDELARTRIGKKPYSSKKLSGFYSESIGTRNDEEKTMFQYKTGDNNRKKETYLADGSCKTSAKIEDLSADKENIADRRIMLRSYWNEVSFQTEVNHELDASSSVVEVQTVQNGGYILDQCKLEGVTSLKEEKTASSTTEDSSPESELWGCSEYTEDIFGYLLGLKYELDPDYMSRQPYLSWSMRSLLVDWLVDVAEEFELGNSVVHAAVTLLDRFLSIFIVKPSKFQLLGVAALLLASKVEVPEAVPSLCELSFMTDYTFGLEQIRKMERRLVKGLEWRVSWAPTALDLIRWICYRTKAITPVLCRAMYLAEKCLVGGGPRILALGWWELGWACLGEAHLWAGIQLSRDYHITPLSLPTNIATLITLVQTIEICPCLTASYRKFSSEQYLRVAALPSFQHI